MLAEMGVRPEVADAWIDRLDGVEIDRLGEPTVVTTRPIHRPRPASAGHAALRADLQAVGYQLRLIPSNKVLARFTSTLDAWPAIIASIDSGRSPRTLSLDWVTADGRTGSISAGPRLERWARHNNGEPDPRPIIAAARALQPTR